MSENLPPGRELDARIAKEVFKLPGVGHYGPTKRHNMHLDQKWCATHEEAMELYKEFWPDEGEQGRASWRDIDDTLAYWKEGWGTLCIPEYSTFIHDAWKVVEKLLDLDENQDIHIEHLYGKWSISTCREDDEWIEWKHSEMSLPHAICLAALKALS